MAIVYLKAFFYTLLCVLTSVLLTWGLSEFLSNSFPPEVFVIAVFVPLIVASPLSVLVLLQKRKIDLAQRQLTAAMTDLQHLQQETEYRASTDMMTGAWNRERFLSHLTECRRKQDQGCFMMIDADHFKSINDQWGHQAGDDALVAIVGAIRETIRDHDVIGRLGGEEFGVFLPATKLTDAKAIAERLRKNIEKLDFKPSDEKRHNLTVSIGIARTRPGQDVTDLMKTADDLLYRAKNQGRNRVLSEAATRVRKAKAA